ncbi:hypothetical protein ABVF61_01570 [Roseibium sp. HPY-6]|uniref:hypothetical protein n=1 Tax=Roseibium sp. HPY-6 TaxID=3229852 RepID=UPI00338E05DE
MPHDDLCVIACYYDPLGNDWQLKNFLIFQEELRRSQIPLFVAELIFGDGSSRLDGKVENLYAVHTASLLWQKERLLNRIASLLPEKYTKVAWCDVDLLFGESARTWAEATSRALEDTPVVQCFSHCRRLAKPGSEPAIEDIVSGFAARLGITGGPSPAVYAEHGHTGYAWAARRDLLRECGLYDACLSGSGDHLMAHAFAGELDSGCFNKVFRDNKDYRDHFLFWAERAALATAGRIGWVDCEISHLWHGDPEKRQYRRRDIQLTEQAFNPGRDLRLGSMGTWEWTARGARLAGWAYKSFEARREA